MPLPMMVPTTMAVAAPTPRSWASCGVGAGGMGGGEYTRWRVRFGNKQALWACRLRAVAVHVESLAALVSARSSG